MGFFSGLTRSLAAQDISFIGTHACKTMAVLMAEEKTDVISASCRRQYDYSTGRWCARKALAAKGIAPQPICMGVNGEPLWPARICGSISHTRGACCAAVASLRRYRSLGLDIENQHRIISRPALALLANEDELDWLGQAGAHRKEYERLIFSAKESVSKLLYPLIRRWCSFSSFSLLPKTINGCFSLVLREDLKKGFRKGNVLCGKYFSHPDWLITLCALENE
jgi:4'-phosphopantetheinyl transferase EntD